jgi:outer membrane murein-binding lipoprotein Lpp
MVSYTEIRTVPVVDGKAHYRQQQASGACERGIGVAIATRWLGVFVLQLQLFGLPGCASISDLREAEAEANAAKEKLEDCLSTMEAKQEQLDEALDFVRSDPTKLELFELRRTAQKLPGLRQELKQQTEQRIAAEREAKRAEESLQAMRQQLELELFELRRTAQKLPGLRQELKQQTEQRIAAEREAKRAEESLQAMRQQLERDAKIEALRDQAVAYLKNDGFEIGFVKGRVSVDLTTYVVLRLEGRFTDGGLLVVEEGGYSGWNRFSHPSIFWYKDGFRSIEFIDGYGSLDTVSEARFFDFDLERRVREAAGG